MNPFKSRPCRIQALPCSDGISVRVSDPRSLTEQSELKRIRSIREQKIEKCFEEFRATVQGQSMRIKVWSNKQMHTRLRFDRIIQND